MDIMMIGDEKLEVRNRRLMPYADALEEQKSLVEDRLAGRVGDNLVFVEHPAVITIGRSGDGTDLLVPPKVLKNKGVDLFHTDRGGRATFHGPGQMVAYPIIMLKKRDLHWYVHTLLDSMSSTLRTFGINAVEKKDSPGLWVNGAKIASIGISVKNWVTYHGIALNVNSDLSAFNLIHPCGQPAEKITSMEKELGRTVEMQGVIDLFEKKFRKSFGYAATKTPPRPSWLTLASPNSEPIDKMERLIGDLRLSTVCQSAHCPNLGECFNRGTATFMILGDRCTRNCRFCAVNHAFPEPLDEGEPVRLARAVKRLGLNYVVITSVTRDDLDDGGAGQFVRTLSSIRKLCRNTLIEILVPDFKGSIRALEKVLNARPDMFNHNIETVPRLYREVRPQANYQESLEVLHRASGHGLSTKSGMMLGLGEAPQEVEDTLADLRMNGCEHLTMGQYLAPSENHYPMARYIPPDEFDHWAKIAAQMGFSEVASGPLVRSSYRADAFFARSNLECCA